MNRRVARAVTMLVWSAILAPAAEAETRVPGCLASDAKDLQAVDVKFGGLAPSAGVARFYEVLLRHDALPCRELTLGEATPTASHALLAPDYRAVPAPYPPAMDELLCRLNPKGCTRGRPTAQTLIAPDVHLEPHYPIWISIPLDSGEDPSRDLERTLKRRSLEPPPDEDRSKWLDRIRKANVEFTRPIEKDLRTSTGRRVQRRLVVPTTEYRATLWLPKSVAELTAQAFGISDFSFDAREPMRVSVRSNGLPPPTVSFAPQFKSALDMISMPSALPDAVSDTPPGILIADRGIDADCVFLHPDRDVPADVLSGLPPTTLGTCPGAEHGTHVWGIIRGRVPQVMRGLASLDDEILDVQAWDFDQHPPTESQQFLDFVQGTVPDVRVANLSIDFERDLTQSRAKDFQKMVEETPSILYVVAAENGPERYRSGEVFSLPLALHARPNVVVVTALDQNGGDVWSDAARNDSAADDVVVMAAPGVGIPSACARNAVGVLSGTSQATAFVSGAAALLARDGLASAVAIKQRLAYTADVLPKLIDGVAGGRLNVTRALNVGDDKICPAAGGDGVTCDAWKVGTVHFGYRGARGFTPAKTVVLKQGSGRVIAEVKPPSAVVRIAKSPPPPPGQEESDGFVAFFIDFTTKRLRRERIASAEAFTDPNRHGPLVMEFEYQDGSPTDHVALEELADFVRRTS